MSNENLIQTYLEEAAKKDEILHIQNEQTAQDIVRHISEVERPAPIAETSDAKWAQLQQDISCGYVLR